MHTPTTYFPKHYMVAEVSAKDASSHLDPRYEQGWRVINMAIHADGRLVFLLERTGPVPEH